jgi:hypothetical protein
MVIDNTVSIEELVDPMSLTVRGILVGKQGPVVYFPQD